MTKAKTIRDNSRDKTLILLISALIREEPRAYSGLGISKGVWLWNRTDSTFICSPGFRRIMNISSKVVPDLDFWINKLSSNDLISFSNVLESVLSDYHPRNFIFQLKNSEYPKRRIKCMLEGMKMQSENSSYVIGVLDYYFLSEITEN